MNLNAPTGENADTRAESLVGDEMKRHAAGVAVVLALSGAAHAQSDEAAAPEEGKPGVEFYGQAMLDAIYDAGRMNPDWRATLRPSEIPISCPGSPGCGSNGTSLLSVQQSSLGFKTLIPTTLGPIKTDFSFDLFGTDGSTKAHLLDAWVESGRFGIGQKYSNFMDIDVLPSIIDYWGPSGMVFVRTPQFRFTPFDQEGTQVAITLESPSSGVDAGRLARIDPELGDGITGHNRLPDLVASYRLEGAGGHFRSAAILRQVGYHNTASIDGNPSGTRTGYGLNLAGTYNISDKDHLNLQVAAGRGIASYMNDGGVDLAPGANLRAEAVQSLGWLIYYNHAWTDKLSSSIGYSAHRQNNTGGQIATAFHKGSYSSVNLLYAATKNVTTGAEFIWGRLEDKIGASQIDYRLQYSTKFAF